MLHCRTISLVTTVFVCLYVTDAAADVVCYVGVAGGAEEAAWLAAVTNLESFDTSGENLCDADEIPPPPCPLADNTDLGSTLTFDKANTELARSFRIQALEESFWFNSPGLGDPRDSLEVGNGVDNYDNDDW